MTEPDGIFERVRLKKQSQFAGRRNGVNSYMKGYYGNKPACGAEKNKAKQSQFHAPDSTKGAGKRENARGSYRLGGWGKTYSNLVAEIVDKGFGNRQTYLLVRDIFLGAFFCFWRTYYES